MSAKVDVIGEENDIIVGKTGALAKELGGRETCEEEVKQFQAHAPIDHSRADESRCVLCICATTSITHRLRCHHRM